MSRNSEISRLRLLLVEDDDKLRTLLREELEENDYTVMEAQCLEDGLRLLREATPDLVVTDLRLPDGRGDQLLEKSMQYALPPPVVLITAFGQVDEAVAALLQGAADFLTKPLDVDHLLLRLERIRELQALRRQLEELQQAESGPKTVPSGAGAVRLGQSPAWRQIENQLPRIARTDDPVLITGPSGTGKELVARALHQLSPRAENPFIPINCAGLPENLLESELFGHSAGAFTGADRTREGLFFAARGGTLLLDEIGEMPLEMQAKLLRVLQEKRVRSVGDDREKPVDVRILASTNRVLEKQIEQGAFRRDLYYRLETFHLTLPPLRERPEDIDLLAAHFLSQAAEELDKKLSGISEAAMEILRAYNYPGNVRELHNIIRRAVAFTESRSIQLRDLPDKLRRATAESTTQAFPGEWVSMDTMRRRYARQVVEHCQGNKQKAARILGVSRPTLYTLIDDEKQVKKPENELVDEG